MGNQLSIRKHYHVYMEDINDNSENFGEIVRAYLDQKVIHGGDHLLILCHNPSKWKPQFTHHEIHKYHIEMLPFKLCGDRSPEDAHSEVYQYWLNYYHCHYHHHFFKKYAIQCSFLFPPFTNERVKLLGAVFINKNNPTDVLMCDIYHSQKNENRSFRTFSVATKKNIIPPKKKSLQISKIAKKNQSPS